MAKLTLLDIGAGTGSATAINANSALIESALENTLSRDGTEPNQMESDLDMNSNRITNLPDAEASQEPVTLGQLADIINDIEGGGGVILPGSIEEDDITDGAILARVADTETISGAWTFTTRPIMEANEGTVVHKWQAANGEEHYLEVLFDNSDNAIIRPGGLSAADWYYDFIDNTWKFDGSFEVGLDVDIGRDIRLIEQDLPSGKSATFGTDLLWALDDAPTTLMRTDDAGNDFPVAMARYLNVSEDTSDVLDNQYINGIYFKDGATGITLTLQASSVVTFPVGAQCSIINAHATTGDITVTEGSGTTLYVLTGSSVEDADGSATVAPGGFATLYRHSASVYYIMGGGVTS